MSEHSPQFPKKSAKKPVSGPASDGQMPPIKVDWTLLKSLAPYPTEAFHFVSEGLAHTVQSIHGHREEVKELVPTDENRHINGRQLCLGLRNYALERYGLLARTVLHRWNIKATEDFGKIVFAMVDARLMRKTDEDTPEDFQHVFDFHEAFPDVHEVARG
ncbi:MAG: hypothetical protein JNK16_12635 [Phycisphaerales bacterium]|nr:hypothetical protein [Phycisphaerales bacterium]